MGRDSLGRVFEKVDPSAASTASAPMSTSRASRATAPAYPVGCILGLRVGRTPEAPLGRTRLHPAHRHDVGRTRVSDRTALDDRRLTQCNRGIVANPFAQQLPREVAPIRADKSGKS